MLFNSVSYLIFFPIVLALYWLAPDRWRKPLLLIASYVFYMSWIPIYAVLIFAMTLCNYVLALVIDKTRAQNQTENDQPSRLTKGLFLFGIVGNVATLCYYKYTGMIVESLVKLANGVSGVFHLQIRAEMPVIDILLPLGISFFAFEFIHYLYDVYKGSRPIYGPIDFALFAAFFPSQIAGPIKRYQFFLDQMSAKINFNGAMFNEGLALLLQGLFKKVAIADNLIPLVNAGYMHTATLGTYDAWIAVFGFAIEVYCDFSGYTDMGRGSAMMLGYNLPINFDFPYLSGSVQEFWRRWHISLSTWLRDYVYIPLGGGRGGTFNKYRNLVITMTIGGLWHGAAWHYVIWGFLVGISLVVNHCYSELVKRTKRLQEIHSLPAVKVFCVVFTMLFMWLNFVLFRADSMKHGFEMYAALFSWRPSSVVVDLLPPNPVLIAMAAYGIYALLYSLPNFHFLPVLGKLRNRMTPNVIPARAIVYLGITLAAFGFAPTAPSPFIYFQF